MLEGFFVWGFDSEVVVVVVCGLFSKYFNIILIFFQYSTIKIIECWKEMCYYIMRSEGQLLIIGLVAQGTRFLSEARRSFR